MDFSAVRAVLHSDQVIAANRRVDAHVLRLLAKPSPRIGYVSSAPEPERAFFRRKQAYYAQYGIADLLYFDPGGDPEGLLGCDAIHLTGGNTRDFLERLRRADMLDALRRYALAGGLLVGTSAGAVLMTPDISVDSLFAGRPPTASAASGALGLVPFEFFPHVSRDPAYLAALVAYSRTNGGRTILACNDGDGIVVERGEAAPVGRLLHIQDGKAVPLSGPLRL